jgi:arylsulfatase A-like enzyme
VDSRPSAADVTDGVSSDNSPVEEDARGEQASNPLVRGLERLVDDSPVFEDAEDLHTQLREADRILEQVKRENREALRQNSRQLVVAPRPNIVLLVADDLGFGDLGCYGQQHIRTPHIDRLAREGLRLDQFYAGGVTSDSSWWCLMTGRYTARYEQTPGSRYVLSPQQRTLAETMWQGGYETAFLGNWYLAGPHEAEVPHLHGFDQWSGTLGDDGSLTHFPDILWSDGIRCRIVSEGDGQAQADINEYLAQQARAFIEQHDSGDPFLLVVSFTFPHQPLVAPGGQRYREQGWNEPQRRYATMVTRLDEHVGEILDALTVSLLEKNTVVLFTSDNATNPGDVSVSQFFASRGDLRGQGDELYEGSIRIPLIARWPENVPAGSTSDFPAALWDLLPTCAELGKVEWHRRPRQLDGISLVPLLEGGEPAHRPRMYWRSFTDSLAQAVRLEPDGTWKAILPAGLHLQQNIELYNLDSDLRETNDLAAGHPDVVASAIRRK